MGPTLAELRSRPHWSASSLQGLLGICSLQWAFRHVYEQPPAFRPSALVFGGALHQALTWYTAQAIAGTPPAAPAVAEVFGEYLEQALTQEGPPVRFRPGQEAEALRELGQRMVAAYLTALDPAEIPVAVAVPFSVRLPGLPTPLIGEVDLILRDTEGAFLVDWKSAARRWSPGKAHLELQPTVYLAAAREEALPVTTTRFRFDIITKTKEPAVDRQWTSRNTDDQERLVARISLAEQLVRRELFLPSDGSWACSDCPFQSPCQSWHRERSRLILGPLAA